VFGFYNEKKMSGGAGGGGGQIFNIGKSAKLLMKKLMLKLRLKMLQV
jgi:hypothetical protein